VLWAGILVDIFVPPRERLPAEGELVTSDDFLIQRDGGRRLGASPSRGTAVCVKISPAGGIVSMSREEAGDGSDR
jgi:hypothetical protein